MNGRERHLLLISDLYVLMAAVGTHIHTHTHTHTYTHTHVHTNIHTNTHIHLQTYMCTYTQTHMYTNIHTNTHPQISNKAKIPKSTCMTSVCVLVARTVSHGYSKLQG